ncbi:MAG: hypothetical protein AAGB22_09930, partial [Bacteroidota bacterium]
MSPPGNYTFQWSPATALDNATIANPQATFSTPGANTVQVMITDTNGCVQHDSVVVQVSNLPAPNLTTTAQPSVVFCPGASTQLTAIVDTAALFSGGLCQTSSSPCGSSTIYGTVGQANLVNTTTSYPAPYGNFFHGAKHQYLLRADELIAGGVQPGNLFSLAFYVEALGNQTNYDNFTLLLGCTSDSVLTNWHSSLTTVFPAQSVTISTGWNHNQFAQSYVWDGTSNLVVEVCFNNGFFTNNGNARTRYTPTGFSSSLHYFADVPSVCPSPAAPQVSTSRANMRFGQCGLVPNQNDYTFPWGPQGSVTSPNQAGTAATVNGSTSYWVTATDTTTGCSSTDTVTVTLDSTNVIDSLFSTMLTCPGSNDGTITVSSSHPGVTGYSIDNGATIQTSGQFTGLAAGTYTVQVYSGFNCFISYMIFVGTVAPVNAVMSNDTNVCSGSLVTLSAQGYGGHGGPYSYQWSFGQTQSSVTFPATTSATYTVTITDVQGCTGTDSVEVLIYPNLVSSFTPNTWVQSGDSTTLCISASG